MKIEVIVRDNSDDEILIIKPNNNDSNNRCKLTSSHDYFDTIKVEEVIKILKEYTAVMQGYRMCMLHRQQWDDFEKKQLEEIK